MLCYEYDCNTVGHENVMKIHLLVCRLGYPEAIVLITLGSH